MRHLSLLATLVLVTALSGMAQAATLENSPFSNLFQPNGITQFKLTDFENVFDSSGNLVTGAITAGDTFQGIYNITTSQTPGGSNVLAPGNFSVTGIFDTVVSAVNSTGTAGVFSFTLVPDPNFNAHVLAIAGTNPGLQAGAMIALYDTPANQFNAAGTLTQAYTTALSGGILTQVGGNASSGTTGWGTSYYWAAVGSGSPGVASFATSLNLLYNNPATAPATNLLAMLNQQAPAGFASPSEMASLFAITNPLALQGNTIINTNSGIPFEIQSQDPLEEESLPEPTGFVVVGGLFGLWGVVKAVRRRPRAVAV